MASSVISAADDAAIDHLQNLARRAELLKKAIPCSNLPAGLANYGPARLWSQVTVDYWEILVACSETCHSWERAQTIPVDDWLQIRRDMVLATGPTPWISGPGETPMLVFAGWRLRPELKLYEPPRLTH